MPLIDTKIQYLALFLKCLHNKIFFVIFFHKLDHYLIF